MKNCLSLHSRKTNHLNKKNSILFNLTNWWAWRSQLETDIKMKKTNLINKIQKWSRWIGYSLLSIKLECRFKSGTVLHSQPFKSISKEKECNLNETGLIKRQPGSSKKLIEEEKEFFILSIWLVIFFKRHKYF